MNPILEQISKVGIVPVIKLNDPSKAVPLAKALKKGGKNAPYQYKDGSNTADGSADPWDVSYPENRPEGDSGYSTEQYGGGFTMVSGGKNFCPYCGVMRQPDYEFCENCGKKLPD